MATSTRILSPKPQYRRKHVVRRNGKVVRVYYTDRSASYSKKDTKKGADRNAHKREVKINSAWKRDAINYGMDYVRKKYGSKITAQVERVLRRNVSDGRAAGQSTLNAPPTAKDGYVARGGRFKDGGPAAPNTAPDMGFKRKYALNLENDSELAQGSHHEFAQATSVSSLITSQLRQANNAPLDYWETWAKDKGGQTQINKRESSNLGLDVEYSNAAAPVNSHNNYKSFAEQDMQAEQEVFKTGAMTSLATSQPMGAFGTNMVMDPGYMHTMAGETDQEDHAGETPEEHAAHMEADLDAGSAAYNPWSEGEGGQYNITGPDPAKIGQSTMEAMALANAYFAPQRMELAYELGDMETDMRRLAVNLGRQVDDPVLQAKLYKEGMRAVRTLDTQQNTFAFQMAEQRRKEEVSNYQFYDSLAQQEYNLRKQNEQFLKRLELDNAYFGLKKDELDAARIAANPPTPNTTPVDNTVPVGGTPTPTAPAPVTSPLTARLNATSGTGGGALLGGGYRPTGK